LSQYDSDVDELYPSERNAATIVWADLQRKYGSRPNTPETLMSFAKEAKDRFYHEVGLNIEVELNNFVQDGSGDLVMSPQMWITSRVNKSGFDFDRAKYEVQHGYADGQVGKINEKGEWRDPDVKA
jgi:hypothetical protein